MLELYPSLGVGLGLRSAHYSHILENRPPVPWFEAITENFLGIRSGRGGKALETLERIRQSAEVVLHGVSLSIGSTDDFDGESNLEYLRRLKTLASRIQPAWISDHLCWTGVGGHNLHDLLPLPMTEEVIAHLVERITRVQDFLGRRILLENVSSYLTFRHSELTEWEFVAEVSRRADCGILLDVNNVYVNAINHGFDPLTYLRGIPAGRVGQMHLAGHSKGQTGILIDTHDHPVCEDVWALYRHAVRRFGAVATLIEWDDRLPPFEELEAHRLKAAQIQLEERHEVA